MASMPSETRHPNRLGDGTPMLDNLGIAYVVLNVLWTTTVLAGSALLWYFRRHECIRKRNVGLSIASVLILQVYWLTNMIMYPLNGAYPCDVNFWVMSIYFPVGIALFQLQNVQLLSVSARQRDLKQQPFRRSNRVTRSHFSIWRYRSSWTQMTLLSRIYFFIGVCVGTQIILTLVVFLVSRKFVSFGVTDQPTAHRYCTHGWEWLITILYQAIWTYFFGPWLLWRIRNIHDVFHWKLQTVLAIVFSLPGLPMWLIATNVPGWTVVTARFPNGCWYNPGICVMQGVALFFPLYEVRKASRYQVRTSTGSEKTLLPSSRTDIESQIKGSAHSLQAFEEALQNGSGQLLEYASTREFTGENIIFLNSVRDFRTAWKEALVNNETPSLEHQQKFFTIATDIFDRSISLHTAQFPVNIEGHIYSELDELFGRDVAATSSVVAPFADRWSISALAELAKISDAYSKSNKPARSAFNANGEISNGIVQNASSDHILPAGTNAVPEKFSIHVFDKAESSVKYMVFTNTWVRYVNSWRHSSTSTISSGKYDLKVDQYPSKTLSASRTDD